MAALVAQVDDDDPRRALEAVAELHREVRRVEGALVRRARVAGAGWAEIARALGVSRQAVHQRYGGARFGRG